MFKENQTIKHIYCKDVAFFVEYCNESPSGDQSLHGFWINIALPEKPYVIDRDLIYVKPEQVDNWLPYTGIMP